MRTFESGAIRDSVQGKGRCDLLPLEVFKEFDQSSAVLKYIDMFQCTGDYRALLGAVEAVSENIYDDMLLVALRFEEGSIKYGDENWKKGIPASVYIDSGVRHYLKYKRGDVDEPHRVAFIWNMVCCVWTCINRPELNSYLK